VIVQNRSIRIWTVRPSQSSLCTNLGRRSTERCKSYFGSTTSDSLQLKSTAQYNLRDCQEALKEFRESDLARTVAEAYEISGTRESTWQRS